MADGPMFPPETLIGRYAALANLGSEYAAGRITDEQYVSRAMVTGNLTRAEAITRCMAIDSVRRP